MADALDEFVVDGIEHNIPFLSALMQHPRWREGRLSTGFIAEEFPDGFHPIVPDDGDKAVLAAVAVAVELIRRDRLDRLAGRLAPHSGKLKRDWVVKLGGDYRRGRGASRDRCRSPIAIDISVAGGSRRWTVASDWRPGDAVWRGTVGGAQDLGADQAAAEWRAHRLERHFGDGARHAAAHRRARKADAGQGAAGHVEAAALPDARAGRLDRWSRSGKR